MNFDGYDIGIFQYHAINVSNEFEDPQSEIRCRNPKSGHPQSEYAKPLTSMEDTRNSLLIINNIWCFNSIQTENSSNVLHV